MGRKIPAKKHRGVKNPLEQQARREKSLKSKVNAPPKDPDEQPVPRSLTRLFAFKDKSNTRSKAINKKKRPSNISDQKSSKGKNPVSELKRLAGESGRSFSLRINSAVRALHDTASIVSHTYPQDMEAEDVKGERMAEQRARRQRKRRAQPAEEGGEAPSRLQRRALRAQAKRDKVDQAAQERAEVRYERVQFGDVAHAPPALLRPVRGRGRGRGGGGGAPRPGTRALLLTPLLAGAAVLADAVAARHETRGTRHAARGTRHEARRRRRPSNVDQQNFKIYCKHLFITVAHKVDLIKPLLGS